MQSIRKSANLVNARFRPLFWVLLLLMVIPLTIMLGHKKYLELPASPNGMVSLELAATDSMARSIAVTWNTDTIQERLNSTCVCDTNVYVYRKAAHAPDQKTARLAIARTDIVTDFFFILLYVLLACVFICRMEAPFLHMRWLLLFTGLAVAAGLCDVIEDIGMLGYLKTPGESPSLFPEPYYSWASKVKFGLLGVLLLIYLPVRIYQRAYLAELSGYVTTKLFQIWRYRVIIAGIVLFSFPLWFSDQGQDLLVNISGSAWSVLLFLVIINLAAFLNWWLAKLFFENGYAPPVLPYIEPAVPPQQLIVEKKASRFLGVVTFLSPAFAMLQALNNYKIHYWANFFLPVIWLLLSISIFYLLIKKDIIDRLYSKMNPSQGKSQATLITIFLVIVMLTITLPFLFWKQPFQTTGIGRSPLALTYISVDLVLLSFAFLVFVTLRNQLIPAAWGWLRERIGIPIYLLAVLVCGLFLLYNVIPLHMSEGISWNFFCLPVLFSGFTFYILFFTLLIRLSQWKKINFTVFFLLICLLINVAVPSNYHNLRFQDRNDTTSYSSRIPLDDYFARWVAHRASQIDLSPGAGDYPVFLVNSYGGGIRASAFTSLVINHLNDSVKKWNSSALPFEHFVFSYSGASGGTIGASVMCAYRYGALHSDATDSLRPNDLMKFYNQDFLTTLVSGAIGRDLWAACSGWPSWQDRSAIQEKLWEYRLNDAWKKVRFDGNFYSYWDTISKSSAFEIPLLFSNTCNVDDGLKGILSPVLLGHDQFPATDFVADQIPADKMVAFSTAAFISARFPLLSPSGKTSDGFHFVDGGIKENSGAETSENIYLALQKFCADSNSIKIKYPGLWPYIHKIKFYLISIGNSSHSKSGPDKKVKNLFQLTSPLIALYNSGVDGNSHKADSTLKARYGSVYASIWPDVDCIDMKPNERKMFSPALPLGWQISTVALDRLEASAKQADYYERVADTIPGFGKIKAFFRESGIK